MTDVLIVYTATDFFKAFRQFGNQRGEWIVWADKSDSNNQSGEEKK